MPGERILVVDDEVSVRETCVRSLTRSGFRAEMASSAAEALARLETATFDLLLADIRMPRMGGLELLRLARQIDPHLTSVILTGHRTLDTAIEAIELGVHGFLLKPFTREELAASVSGALEKARLIQENTRLRALLPLFDVSSKLMVEDDVEALYHLILSAARQTSEATASWLLVEPEPSAGARALPDGEGNDLAGGLVARWPSLAAYFARTPASLVIKSPPASGMRIDDKTAERSESPTPALALDGLREHVAAPHCVAVPLMTARRIVGALVIERQTPFRESDLELLGILATQGASAIENTSLHQKRQQAIRVRDEFLSVAAHELKTPIAVLQGHAELLIDQIPPDSRPNEAAAVIAIGRQSANLTRLVQELLVASRLQFGCLELRLARWDLAELVADVLAEMQALNPRHQFLLDRVKHLFVEADREHIRHVLENVLNNAVRFCPDGGPVRVQVAANGGEALVSIQDQGLGIPVERQARMFERFYRAHAGTAHDTGGIGLGLYVCFELIAQHGGRIWVESQERVGSIFSFSLPLAGQALDTDATSS